MKKIIQKNIAVLLGAVILTLGLPLSVASAHGGGPDEYTPSITSETTDTVPNEDGGTNFLPYAVGGSVLIVAAVAGVAVWQRRKNS